jgi:hypothetical protein
MQLRGMALARNQITANTRKLPVTCMFGLVAAEFAGDGFSYCYLTLTVNTIVHKNLGLG